jgi:hypothetical protein
MRRVLSLSGTRDREPPRGIELTARGSPSDTGLALRLDAVGQIAVLLGREARRARSRTQIDAAVQGAAAEQVPGGDIERQLRTDECVLGLRGHAHLHALGHELLDLEVVRGERLVGNGHRDPPVTGVCERRQHVIERDHTGRVCLQRQLLRDLRARVDELDVDGQRGIRCLVFPVAHDRGDMRGIAGAIHATI